MTFGTRVAPKTLLPARMGVARSSGGGSLDLHKRSAEDLGDRLTARGASPFTVHFARSRKQPFPATGKDQGVPAGVLVGVQAVAWHSLAPSRVAVAACMSAMTYAGEPVARTPGWRLRGGKPFHPTDRPRNH